MKSVKISNQRFVGVKGVFARHDPFTVPSTQTYTKAEQRDLPGLSDQLQRVKRRNCPIRLENPAHHEVHFTGKTLACAGGTIADPTVQIAAVFTVHDIPYANGARVLDTHNGNTAIITGPDGDENLYYYLRWDDVLYNPMREKKYTGPAQTARKLARCRYPRRKFSRMEKGCLVRYLKLAGYDELAAVKASIQAGATK
jgi:hypothetical protein